MSDASRRPGWENGTRFAVAAVVVASVPLSIVVTGPLQAAGLLWPLYGVLLAWAAVTAVRTRAWRDPAFVLLLAFWALFAAWAPYALRIAPNPLLGQREVEAMAAGGVVTGVVAGLARGRRALAAVRVGWLGALLLTGGIAVWEIVTHHHMWEAERPWPFPKHTMVAATLYNPNNYGTALVAMIAAALAARTAALKETRPGPAVTRAPLTGLSGRGAAAGARAPQRTAGAGTGPGAR